MNFYFSTQPGEVQGPVTESVLRALYKAHTAGEDTQVCAEGTTQWIPIREWYATCAPEAAPAVKLTIKETVEEFRARQARQQAEARNDALHQLAPSQQPQARVRPDKWYKIIVKGTKLIFVNGSEINWVKAMVGAIFWPSFIVLCVIFGLSRPPHSTFTPDSEKERQFVKEQQSASTGNERCAVCGARCDSLRAVVDSSNPRNNMCADCVRRLKENQEAVERQRYLQRNP